MPESTPINWYYIGLGFIVTMLGQVGAWYQHNMQFKYPNLNEWWWGWYVLAIPLTYLFMTATKYNVLGYGGSIWGARFVGFAIGMGAYAILTTYYFKEPFSLKIAFQLILCFSIILVQAYWK